MSDIYFNKVALLLINVKTALGYSSVLMFKWPYCLYSVYTGNVSPTNKLHAQVPININNTEPCLHGRQKVCVIMGYVLLTNNHRS